MNKKIVYLKLLPSQMLWQCSTPDCPTEPKVQNRNQYKDIKHCQLCANRIKAQNTEMTQRRGKTLSTTISSLGDQWSKTALINMSNPITRAKIAQATSDSYTPEKREISRQTALTNNKVTGFGTVEFSKNFWGSITDEEKQKRFLGISQKGIETDRIAHIAYVKDRYPNFTLLEFGHPNNIYKCEHNHIFPMRGGNFLKRGNCPECAPRSQSELDILQFMKGLVSDTESNRRVLFLDETKNGNKALEIDVYSPSKQFGVEMHGLYWHDSNRVDKDYHQIKKVIAHHWNIQLLQFFEDEWAFQRPIVESMIKAKLGIFDKVYGGRELTFKMVEKTESMPFFTDNHLQGDCRDAFRFGLYNQDELICCVSVRKKDDYLEIARFASKKGVLVRGAFPKLMARVVEKAKQLSFTKILTYADLRYSTGKVYSTYGFQLMSTTDPDMFFVCRNERLPRQASWSDKAIAKLPKIYGTGHYRFELTL